MGDKYILAQADPFDSNVDGVKIPDANCQPSVAFKAEDVYDLATTVGETTRLIGINPTLEKTFFGSQFVDPDTWTYSAAYAGSKNHAKLTQLRSDFELFRPVAHAVRITSGLSPLTVTGFLHVAVFTMANFGQTTWACPTTLGQLQSVPGYRRYPLGRLTSEGVTVINRPMDCTSQRYIDTDNTIFAASTQNEFNTACQWGVILVAVSGVAASTTPVSIETIMHYECIPRSTSISQSTPAARYNVDALAGAAAALSSGPASALDSERPQVVTQAVRTAVNNMSGADERGRGGRWGSMRDDIIARRKTPKRAGADGNVLNTAVSMSNVEGM